ncbi:hypothetical protein LCGC14_1807540 [marine sediment metagenome]|uniref:Uncharacterized protein n=1 Tax=marine sediment metagenome TaxID=412755 RepID=A0A0F9JMF5_9ZZZZ
MSWWKNDTEWADGLTVENLEATRKAMTQFTEAQAAKMFNNAFEYEEYRKTHPSDTKSEETEMERAIREAVAMVK